MVYLLLKARGLIASPTFIVIKAADEFKHKTTAPNQLWQTDFTYLKVIGGRDLVAMYRHAPISATEESTQALPTATQRRNRRL